MTRDVTELQSSLLGIERGFWTSGVEYYREHLSDDCVMLFPGAGILTRDGILDGVAGGRRWSDVQIGAVHIVPLGVNAAIVAYRAVARRVGSETAYSALVSSAYLKQQGAWKLALHQQSPLAGT